MSSKNITPPSNWDDFQAHAVAICRKVGTRFNPVIPSRDLLSIAWLVFNDHRSKFNADRASFPTFFSMKLKHAIEEDLGSTYKRQLARKDQESDELLDVPTAEVAPVEDFRSRPLSFEQERFVTAMRNADTAKMAEKNGTTRRRAQQQIKEQIVRASLNLDLFGKI